MGRMKELLEGTILGRGVKPDAHTWLFSSSENVHFDSNARYLFTYVREHCPEIKPRFVINDPALRQELGKTYGREYFLETLTREGKRHALSAGVWFTSAGLAVYGLGLSRGRLIINLWHGIPLKKIALADPNLSKASRLVFRKVFSQNYYKVVTCSKRYVPIMAEAFGVGEEKVAIWGQPRCDSLFGEAKGSINLQEHRTINLEGDFRILYAPTFRDGGKTWLFPFADYNKEELEAFLARRHMVLYLRLHHLDGTDPGPYLSEHVRILGTREVEDVTASLPLFDILVTDYSSIYIDYLLLDRPIVFLPYDEEAYMKGRGMYYPYGEVSPGPRPGTQEAFLRELEDAFRRKDDSGGDACQEERRRVRDFYHEVQRPACPGIVQEVEEELKRRGWW